MGYAIYSREAGILDGIITNVAVADLGNANTSYTYFNLLRDGMKHAAIHHILTATTLTIETCEIGLSREQAQGQKLGGTATATDGTGAILTDSTLATPFPTDTDLIGIQVRIIADGTTPANVGLTRTVTAHTGATGALTLSSAIGAITSGVTRFQLEDSPSEWGRKLSDPTSAQWDDSTLILTNAASHTTSGKWFLDTDLVFERGRIKRVTTNATNACAIRMSRGR